MANPIRAKIESAIVKSLTEEASNIAEKAKANAGWSSTIPEAISITEAKKTGDGFEISIVVDSSEEGPAPHAAAFEYGSGEHSQESPGKYIIAPKERGALAFEWEPAFVPWGSKKFIGLADGGKFLFRFVEHPGVEPRPYLQPAIESEQGRFRSKLAKRFRDAYRESIVRVEVISVKK